MTLVFRSLFLAFLAMLAMCMIMIDTGATSQADAVDTYIAEQMQKDNIPGLSVAVVKGGKIAKA